MCVICITQEEEKVQDAAHDLPLTHETNVSIRSLMLDSLSGHLGGYERDMGRGYKRKFMVDDSLGVGVTSRHEHDLMRKIKQHEAHTEKQQKQIDKQQSQLEEMNRKIKSQQVAGGQTIDFAILMIIMSRGLNIDLFSIRHEDGNVGEPSRRSGDTSSAPSN